MRRRMSARAQKKPHGFLGPCGGFFNFQSPLVMRHSLRARPIVEQQQANIRAITLQLRKPGPSSPPKKGMT
jgi:hypothetical protein